MSADELGRSARRLADALQEFRLLCKQMDHKAGELQEMCEGACRVSEKVLGEAPRLVEKEGSPASD